MSSTRTRVLGTTKIEQPLAKGGMAEVYRGTQRSLGRDVAVKVMLPEVARDREMVRRFRREARSLASLCHQNIVAVHDLVEKNGQIFIIMELVDGVDVRELLRAGPLPLDVALIVATSVARALEHAHYHKIIHRDIKPANVLVSRDGTTKLTDLGVAKDLTAKDITEAGFVVGTPAYLAPELLRGQPADARSDFYALGVLLYECIAGRRPFRGKTAPELYRVILAGERQRLREAAPECKRSVERVVDRCLSANPDERWGRASELRMQLELELNRVFDANPSARLASFLYERGHAHPEHLATINLAEIAVFDPSIEISIKESLPALSLNVDVDELEDDAGDEEASASGRFGLLRGVGVAVGLFAAAALVTWLVAPEWVQQTLQRAIALLSSS